jgi:hypothetical protein
MTEEHPPEDTEEIATPMSFKVMIAATVIYLGWRLIQGIVWLWNQIG